MALFGAPRRDLKFTMIFVAYLFLEIYHHLSWYQSFGFCDGYLKAVYWCLVNISSSNKKYPASISNSKISDFRPTNEDGDDNNFVVMFWSSSDYHLIIVWSSSNHHHQLGRYLISLEDFAAALTGTILPILESATSAWHHGIIQWMRMTMTSWHHPCNCHPHPDHIFGVYNNLPKQQL